MTKGFDLSDLAWVPGSDDEREQVRRHQPWFTYWPQLNDDEAEALLREILALRRIRLRSEHPDEGEKQRALHLAARLIEGTAGWAAAEDMPLSYLMRDTPDPKLNRMVATWSLKLPVPLMPAATRQVIAEALEQLWDGVVPPILKPSVGGRRGIAGRRRQEIELELLGWVEWQVARKGLRIKDALKAVAQACGLETGQAVRNWRKRLVERLENWESTKGYVDNILKLPKTIGLMEAAGGDPSQDPALAADAIRLRLLDLQRLGKEYRGASLSRTDPA